MPLPPPFIKGIPVLYQISEDHYQKLKSKILSRRPELDLLNFEDQITLLLGELLDSEKKEEIVYEIITKEEKESSSPKSLKLTRSQIDEFTEVWNENCGELPKVRQMGKMREKLLLQYFKECGGDMQLALETLRYATLEVSSDSFYLQSGYGLENILRGKVFGRAERYLNKQQHPTAGQKTIAAKTDWLKGKKK